MDHALEHLSKEDLVRLISQTKSDRDQLALENRYLKEQISQLQRMLYGQKRERFEADAAQLSLPFPATEQVATEQQAVVAEKMSDEREKQKRPNHKGRVPLPDHLEVEEVELHPEGDLTDMVRIGKEVTEELEYVPAKLYIKRYIRYKYAPKTKEGVLIARLPDRVIDKGIPGPGLLAAILVDKYKDHLPLYRQRQRFLRRGASLSASTLDGWVKRALDKLDILYQHLLVATRAKGYLQADESPIKVLDRQKKGKTHQGYYWVYHNPLDGNVLFDYQQTRSKKAAQHVLTGFKGYLQTDGYGVYQALVEQAGGTITHLACWAHARREFEKAMDNDQAKATVALTYIQQLYAIERSCKEAGHAAQQRKQIRLDKALPIINELGKWLAQQAKTVLPKSAIGKAVHYAINRWDSLTNYLYDGQLQIDNNLIENAIRPLALGRKNYLFAGSHQAAQRAAIIYSFFAICKKQQVDPFKWLKYVLENIMDTSIQNLQQLYPQNFHNTNM